MLRTFECRHYGKLIGKVRAKNGGNAFKSAAKKWPHLAASELDLIDPEVKVIAKQFGRIAFVPKAA